MSKMGISAIQSYHGAQVFEAVGLRQDVIDQYFTWTRLARRRHRHGRHRAGGADAPPRRLSARGTPTAMRCPPAASTSGAATASTTCSIPSRSIACRRRCAPTATPRTRSYAQLIDDQSKQPVHAARPAGLQGGRRRSRSRKSSRSRASSGASRPARCPTARSARRRTRPSPSP